MAKHNEVRIYGQVATSPRIFKDDKTGELLRGMASVITIRGVRSIGNKMDNVKYDAPIIMSGNPEIIAEMEKWKAGDMVEVKGSITSKDVVKTKTCPCCKKKNKKKGTTVFINPVFVAIRETGLNDKEKLENLRKNHEISNNVTIIGVVCREIAGYITKKGLSIASYQIASQRKYRIREDATETRTDFPWIKSYGTIAKNDINTIKKGTLLLVDGMLQTRDVECKHTCEFCGEQFPWQDTAMEIVPYATEYLRNYYTKEEIENREHNEAIQAIKKIFNENEITTPDTLEDVEKYQGDGFKDLSSLT